MSTGRKAALMTVSVIVAAVLALVVVRLIAAAAAYQTPGQVSASCVASRAGQGFSSCPSP